MCLVRLSIKVRCVWSSPSGTNRPATNITSSSGETFWRTGCPAMRRLLCTWELWPCRQSMETACLRLCAKNDFNKTCSFEEIVSLWAVKGALQKFSFVLPWSLVIHNMDDQAAEAEKSWHIFLSMSQGPETLNHNFTINRILPLCHVNVDIFQTP